MLLWLSIQAIGSLSVYASLSLQTTSHKEDWSVFLNGQIRHCPIRPYIFRPIATPYQHQQDTAGHRNYCLAVMCKLTELVSSKRSGKPLEIPFLFRPQFQTNEMVHLTAGGVFLHL